ncbi:MAG: BMP family ABC transporter substrate-binding protein [Lachnospiraceae bacterium]|jgi:basic membrane protein A|nr:BMP family ABC transporter substrate-binding protein [Lachnospiraceae bacterium]
MKKRILALMMVAVMLLSLAACGGSPAQGESGESKTEGGDDKVIRVGMVTDVGGINDHSFNETSWKGLQQAETELGIETKYVQSNQDSDYNTNIQTLLDDGYDLIICVGFKLAQATRAAAEANPDQKFAIIDDASNQDLPNVACLMFEQAQASYLVGVVAGMMTEKNNVGFVIGENTGPMNQFGYGYLAGVLDTNPNATIQQYNANSFTDAGSGKTAAKDMITKGADVIYHAAGAVGAGVIEACNEEKVWAIGVDTDQSSLAPDVVLTSAMKRVDNASYDIAKAVLEGTFSAGVHVYGMENGGVDIAPTTTLLPEEVLSAVEKAKEDILAGNIVVPSDQASFEAKYGDVYKLDD